MKGAGPLEQLWYVHMGLVVSFVLPLSDASASLFDFPDTPAVTPHDGTDWNYRAVFWEGQLMLVQSCTRKKHRILKMLSE